MRRRVFVNLRLKENLLTSTYGSFVQSKLHYGAETRGPLPEYL